MNIWGGRLEVWRSGAVFLFVSTAVLFGPMRGRRRKRPKRNSAVRRALWERLRRCRSFGCTRSFG
ncbi:MAG: hypothetical protein Ct9H300mP1_27160 [Planctomycetaceae bacterium]|nr:MAG: hypothetical protein Ct9H300mP1_27160 [Planctomycetaceae bacterium]